MNLSSQLKKIPFDVLSFLSSGVNLLKAYHVPLMYDVEACGLGTKETMASLGIVVETVLPL